MLDGVAVAESAPKLPTTLELAIQKYKGELNRKSLTPETVTEFWQVFLTKGLLKCDWTPERINAPMKDIKGNDVPGMMVPKVFRGEKGLRELGEIFSQRNNVVSQGAAHDSPDAADTEVEWVKVEATIDSPNLDAAENDIRRFAKEQGYRGQTLNTNILASQASKVLTGHFLDESFHSSVLLGSDYGRGVDEVVNAHHHWGSVDVHANYTGMGVLDHGYGWRFEEVKKA